MTSGGQREHRVEVLEQNLRDMDLDPSDFTFYTDGFRYGAPLMRVGDSSGSTSDGVDGAGNVREVVLPKRQKSRHTLNTTIGYVSKPETWLVTNCRYYSS